MKKLSLQITIPLFASLGILLGIWDMSWFYHMFYVSDSWNAFAIIVTGLCILTGTVALSVWAGFLLGD